MPAPGPTSPTGRSRSPAPRTAPSRRRSRPCGSLLAQAPATEDDLECGEQEGRSPGAVHHNCSGKHAGFLAVCHARGWEAAGYRLAEHPLQQALHEEIAEAAEATDIPTAVDGCGV